MPNDRCAKPGCGALRLVGKPCTDRDCPQIWVHHTEAQHRERAAAAAAWMAAREAGAATLNKSADETKALADRRAGSHASYELDEDEQILRHHAEQLRALPPPADAMAALAEVVRKAKEGERASIIERARGYLSSARHFGNQLAIEDARARTEGGE